MWQNWQGNGDDTDRGASPIVGIVVLVGMVFLGAMLVFVVGSAMFDSIGSEVDREKVHMCMDEADHRLGTVAATRTEQPMAFDDPDCQPEVVDEGTLEITWYNSSTEDPPWDDENRNVSEDLGALEFELDDRTIAHQGGGIWELGTDGTAIISEPEIGYDGESLQFDLLHLDEAQLDGSDPIARTNYSATERLNTEIIEAAKNSPHGTDIAFRIRSPYHDGWERYLEDELGDDATVEKTGPETVTVKITDVRDPVDPATFVVAEDKGLKDSNGDQIDPPVLSRTSSAFQIDGVIENIGDGDNDTQQEVGITIEDGSNDGYNGSVELTLDPGEKQDISELSQIGQFPAPNSAHFEFTAGETYEYTIWTQDDELDEPGSFYYGEPGTYLEVDVTTEDENGNVTITADVRNVGVDDAADEEITLAFPDLGVESTREIDLDYGANGTVEWTVAKGALPLGDNDFTIATGDETTSGTIEGGLAGGAEPAFVVVGDEGVTDDQFVADDGSPFTVSAAVASTYAGTETREVTLSIPDANVEITETVTLDNGDDETIDFTVDPDNHDFEHGEVYEYDVQAEGDGLEPTGSFYFGHPGTEFELSNGNATVDDEEITITADLHNTGVEDGEQDVTVDLELRDDENLEEDPYAEPIDAGTAERAVGENATIELPINESVLIKGTYDATIATDDDEVEATVNVTAGVDPGRVGLGDIEGADVTVDVLGSQVSADSNYHYLAPMTLDVVANGETIHSFENPEGGNNTNTGPTWQDKSADSYTYSFTVEDETELTLRNSRYQLCNERNTHSSSLDHYDGPEFWSAWCNDVPDDIAFEVDASQDVNDQNVRVRSHENNTIPALPAGTDQQLSATEVLEQHGLVKEGEDELDLGPGEFMFLFENTESADEEGIDALWDEAIGAYENNPDETHDPNFNDLIVYVEVERAGVDPGKPSITINPGSGDEADVDPGDGDDPGTPGNPELDLDGEVDPGDSPDVGTGESNDPDSTTGTAGDDTGIDIGSDHVVIG